MAFKWVYTVFLEFFINLLVVYTYINFQDVKTFNKTTNLYSNSILYPIHGKEKIVTSSNSQLQILYITWKPAIRIQVLGTDIAILQQTRQFTKMPNRWSPSTDNPKKAVPCFFLQQHFIKCSNAQPLTERVSENGNHKPMLYLTLQCQPQFFTYC